MLRIGLPPKVERDALTDIIQNCKIASNALCSKMEKLRLQKAGLMQDLLTGKVSVVPLLENAIP
jgi:type I restriction enzyme S subunit